MTESRETPHDVTPSGPDPRLRMILFGGGHGNDYREAEMLFGAWVGPGANVLLIAGMDQHPVDVQRDVDRISGHLREHGVTRLSVWDASVIDAPGFVPDLTPFDGICFSASLPHQILRPLRMNGLDQAVIDAARTGCVVYTENLMIPILGPDARYTGLRDYWIGEHDLEDDAGLGLTTDQDGRPTIYMGRYRGLPSGNRIHPQRVANETRSRVCVIPPVGMVTIRDGIVREVGRRAFDWYEPKPRRNGQKAVLKGSRDIASDRQRRAT